MQKKCQLHSTENEPQYVQSLCLESSCQNNRLLCFFCIHTVHQKHEMIFLKKELPKSLHQFYQTILKRSGNTKDKMQSQQDQNKNVKSNTTMFECYEVKKSIQIKLKDIQNQYQKITQSNYNNIMELSPEKFIENIYQNQELIQVYVKQILQLKQKKPQNYQNCINQINQEYLNSLKRLEKFTKNVAQMFTKKCQFIHQKLYKKNEEKNNFINKIQKMMQNRSAQTKLTNKATKSYQIIDLEQKNQDNQKDFLVQTQKGYLKRLKKTKSIIKSDKQQKLQTYSRLNQKSKKVYSQEEKLLKAKHPQIKQKYSHKGIVNQKRNSYSECPAHTFFDDSFGIPKINNQILFKSFSQQSKICQEHFQKNNKIPDQDKSQHQQQEAVILDKIQEEKQNLEVNMAFQVNNLKKEPEIVQQQKNIQAQVYQNVIQKQKQNSCLQPHSFSQNNSEDPFKNQITKIIQEENERQNQILSMGQNQQKPIILQNMPNRLFSIIINDQLKLQQQQFQIPCNQNSQEPEDFKDSDYMQDQLQSQISNNKKRGRPSKYDKELRQKAKIKSQNNSNQKINQQSGQVESISIKKVVLQCYDHEQIDNSLKLLNKKEIKQLHISTDCMESAIDEQTINIIIKMKNLEKLHIYPCSNIEEKSFFKLIKNLKHLKQLVLHQFNKFSLACSESLLQYLPFIEKVSFGSDYANHMTNIQDNYQFLNSFVIQNTLKKAITLANLTNLTNLILINVGNCVNLQTQVKKIVNKMKNLKQICFMQTQSSKPGNYQFFFQLLSKKNDIKLKSVVLQNVLFYENNLIQIFSRSQQMHTFMIHECPKQFTNKLISGLSKYCKKLEQLSIFQNDSITGEDIFQLKQLKILALRGTWGINKDVFAKKILNLKNLQRLLLNCNNFWFDDSLMKVVCNIKQLKTLNIDFTKVTDEGIQHIRNLQKLQVLIFGNTQVTMQCFNKLLKQSKKLAASIKKLGLNKTKIKVKKNNSSSSHDIDIKPLKNDLLNDLGILLPNLTHLAIEGLQKIFKQNLISFTNLKCIRYSQNSLTNDAQNLLNNLYVFLNSNPW